MAQPLSLGVLSPLSDQGPTVFECKPPNAMSEELILRPTQALKSPISHVLQVTNLSR